MEDLALHPKWEVDWPDSEPAWLAALRQEVVELRAEVAQLRRENLELRQQAGYWRTQHAAAKQRIAELEQEVAQLRGENRKLQDQLGTALFAPLEWFHELTLGLVAEGLSW